MFSGKYLSLFIVRLKKNGVYPADLLKFIKPSSSEPEGPLPHREGAAGRDQTHVNTDEAVALPHKPRLASLS